MTVVIEHIRHQNRYVRSILSDMKPMKTPMAEQQLQHAATTCELCHGQFTKKTRRRHIIAISADFTLVRIAIRAIWNWNLKKVPTSIRPIKRRRKHERGNRQRSSSAHSENSLKKAKDIARDNDDLNTTDYMMTEDSCMNPVVFHNLKGYDSHLTMQYITREYAPRSIDVIPTSSEKLLSFQIGNLRFQECLQFVTASLDTLVQSLAADGKDTFSHTARHYPDSGLLFRKGKLPLRLHGRKRQIFIDRTTSHRRLLQFTFRRNYHSGRVRPGAESAARIRHRKHEAIPQPLPIPRCPSAGRCFWKLSANVHLGLWTRPLTLLHFTRLHIRCVSEFYRTEIRPVYR